MNYQDGKVNLTQSNSTHPDLTQPGLAQPNPIQYLIIEPSFASIDSPSKCIWHSEVLHASRIDFIALSVRHKSLALQVGHKASRNSYIVEVRF